MSSVDTYNSLINTQSQRLIVAYEQIPTDLDYSVGFIYRYFIRKRNDNFGIITEVSKQSHDIFQNDSFYLTLTMKWKITGANKFEVEQLNQRSINYAQETMGNIDTYVKNLTKFYRG
jgi:hypothetical protein